jgi:hypothetical protein
MPVWQAALLIKSLKGLKSAVLHEDAGHRLYKMREEYVSVRACALGHVDAGCLTRACVLLLRLGVA